MGILVLKTSIVEEPPEEDPVMGTIGGYEELSLATHDIYTVDLAEQDYPLFTSEGGSVSYNAAYGIDGRPGVRCFPPTTSAGYGAMGEFDFFRGGGSSNFTNFYLRFCMQVRADYAANNDFDAVKYCIVHSHGGPNSTASDPIRPMVYLDSRLPGIAPANSCFICPAQGTSRYFSESHPGDQVFDGDGRCDFYFGQSATTYAGKRVIAPTDWVCVEMWCESDQTGSFPNGLIRQRVTARDGTVLSDLDTTMTWQHDPAVPFTKYFYSVQVLGGYYNGQTTSAGADNCTAIDRYITFAKNQSDFLGPPTGFLS